MSALDQAAAGFGGACVGLVVGANWPRMAAWLVTRHARTTRAYNAEHHGAVTTRHIHDWGHFSRVLCACGWMHTHCTDCGAQHEPCEEMA